MTTTKIDLVAEVNKFRRSSAFTPGDAFSFTVALTDQVKLPGKFDPAAYLDKLGVAIPDRVAVICPGNGGLCAELLKRGAKEVWAFEPRNQYFAALTQIAEFHRLAKNNTFFVNLRAPTMAESLFDLILWPEGFEEIRDPLQPLIDTINALRSGGRLLVEVAHGAHKASPAKINSWRPSEAAFIETVKANKDCKHLRTIKGRNGSRLIHEIVSLADDHGTIMVREGAAEATITPLAGPAASALEDIAFFSEQLKKALLQTTAIPPELLEPRQVVQKENIDPALLSTKIGTSSEPVEPATDPVVEPAVECSEPPKPQADSEKKDRRKRR